jgi:hypothetical protein
MILQDISAEGRVLIAGGLRRTQTMGMLTGDTAERDFSLFDWGAVEDISADGNLLLFDESGEGGGANWAVYLRNAQTGANTRLGDGRAGALAPDGRWVAVIDPQGTPEITLVPVGEGTRRKVATGGVTPNWVRYFPDGQRLLITAARRAARCSSPSCRWTGRRRARSTSTFATPSSRRTDIALREWTPMAREFRAAEGRTQSRDQSEDGFAAAGLVDGRKIHGRAALRRPRRRFISAAWRSKPAADADSRSDAGRPGRLPRNASGQRVGESKRVRLHFSASALRALRR